MLWLNTYSQITDWCFNFMKGVTAKQLTLTCLALASPQLLTLMGKVVPAKGFQCNYVKSPSLVMRVSSYIPFIKY